MKKTIITLFGLVFLFNSIQAQTYRKFPESNFVWNYWLSYYDGMPCGGNFQFVKLYFSGDTVINSNVYHKIYRSSVHYPYVGCGPPYYESSIFCDYIRQDTILKKVYRLNPTTQTDTLLIDFDLTIGQIHPATQLIPENQIYVSSIDSILLGDNLYHKVFNFTQIDSVVPNYCFDTIAVEYVSLVEGIGYTRGFSYGSEYGDVYDTGWLTYPECDGLWGVAPRLECFGTSTQLYGNVAYLPNGYEQKDSVYFDSTAALCNITLAIEDFNSPNSIRIYPNPTFDNLYLDLPQFEAELNYCIYDIHGRTILKSNLSLIEKRINVSMLQSGLYFLQVESSPSIMKFIKQ